MREKKAVKWFTDEKVRCVHCILYKQHIRCEVNWQYTTTSLISAMLSAI